jgi:hypothetical protein
LEMLAFWFSEQAALQLGLALDWIF